MSRTLAREVAFMALFQLEFNHGEDNERETFISLAIETAIDEVKEQSSKARLNKENLLYIDVTVRATRTRIGEIDEIIKAYLQKSWTLSRLGSVDRNILRLGVYELKFAENKLPIGVVINEAVNLAKKYGTDDSRAFVNGILNAIAH